MASSLGHRAEAVLSNQLSAAMELIIVSSFVGELIIFSPFVGVPSIPQLALRKQGRKAGTDVLKL